MEKPLWLLFLATLSALLLSSSGLLTITSAGNTYVSTDSGLLLLSAAPVAGYTTATTVNSPATITTGTIAASAPIVPTDSAAVGQSSECALILQRTFVFNAKAKSQAPAFGGFFDIFRQPLANPRSVKGMRIAAVLTYPLTH